jgi:hypothetical protein
MSDFWLDAATNTLIYPGPPAPQLVTTIPELRVNGHYFAVPRTLRTSQVLRWLNYPVPPIMDGYDFPHAPDIEKPLPHQKVYANFQALHPKCFNLGDPGCAAGNTLIETDKGPVRIDALTKEGKAIRVYASTNDGIRLVAAECPFVKGFEPIYRVVFASGRTIDVTAKHFFLTSRGWTSCADLEVGEQLPKFDVAHPVSTSEFYLSVLRQGELRSKQTIPDFPDYCDTRVCDEQLLRAVNNVRSSIPSQADSQARSLPSLQKDATDTKHKCTYRPFVFLHSTHRCAAPIDPTRKEVLTDVPTSTQIGSLVFLNELSQRETFPRQPFQPTPKSDGVCLCRYQERSPYYAYEHDIEPLGTKYQVSRPLGEWRAPPELVGELSQSAVALAFDTVINISYLKTDLYYDLHVPVHENYIAHGVCNHNTMKTLATLWAADWLMQQFPPGQMRALILCPLTIVETVWGKAIFKNLLGRRSFQILIGDGDKRMKLLDKPADLYILNYDGIKVGTHFKKRAKPNEPRIVLDGFSQALARRTDINLIICDEARKLSDPGTDRYKVTEMIVKNKPYIWELTGTPLSGGPLDAYGMAKLVNNAFGKSFTGFRLETMMHVSTHVWKPQRDGYDKARRLLTPAVRFDIREIWDGPKMTFQRRKVELTDEQKKQMHALKHNLQIMVSSGQLIDATSEAAARTKFIQISLGAIYDGDHKAHVLDAAPRYREIEELIESTDRKVVICVPITSVVHILVDYLKARWKKKGFKWTTDFMNGEVSARERPKLVQRFEQDDNFKAIVVDPGVIAHGINEFVVADTIIWAGATDKTEDFIQANKRIERPGQKYPSTCYQIVSNKLEEQIFDRLETNTSMQGLMLQAVRNGAF